MECWGFHFFYTCNMAFMYDDHYPIVVMYSVACIFDDPYLNGIPPIRGHPWDLSKCSDIRWISSSAVAPLDGVQWTPLDG